MVDNRCLCNSLFVVHVDWMADQQKSLSRPGKATASTFAMTAEHQRNAFRHDCWSSEGRNFSHEARSAVVALVDTGDDNLCKLRSSEIFLSDRLKFWRKVCIIAIAYRSWSKWLSELRAGLLLYRLISRSCPPAQSRACCNQFNNAFELSLSHARPRRTILHEMRMHICLEMAPL